MTNAFAIRNKRAIRARVNPLDICTLISIYPKDVKAVKHTVTPSDYFIAKGTYESPSILHIKPASWWKETGEDEPLLEIPDSSMIVADAIVKDYCNGIFACDMDSRMPGLFFIPGELTVADIKTKHKDILDAAKVRQDNWFNELINFADMAYAASNGSPRSIDDNMRMAANAMGVKDSKPWMQNYIARDLVHCPACGTLKNPVFPVCPACNTVVDLKKYKDLGLMPAATK